MSMAAYADILFLPRPVSEKRKRMTALERAAQFSPFAALTGYDAAIAESVRLTDAQAELGDWERTELDDKLRFLMERVKEHPEITVTYFQPDPSKSGGKYETVSGRLKRLKTVEREMLLTDGSAFSLDAVSRIESPIFDALEL